MSLYEDENGIIKYRQVVSWMSKLEECVSKMSNSICSHLTHVGKNENSGSFGFDDLGRNFKLSREANLNLRDCSRGNSLSVKNKNLRPQMFCPCKKLKRKCKVYLWLSRTNYECYSSGSEYKRWHVCIMDPFMMNKDQEVWSNFKVTVRSKQFLRPIIKLPQIKWLFLKSFSLCIIFRYTSLQKE